MVKEYRIAILAAAWIFHLAFIIIGYPLVGVSVLLPSILLCGLASWLFNSKIGLITLLLTHPFHMLAIVYSLEDMQAWRIAIDPRGIYGGITVQLCAVCFVAKIKDNHRKSYELTASLETRIRERNKELQQITEYLLISSEAERSRMSDSLCNIVARQQTELYYHCEALQNYLSFKGAPQAEAAAELVQIAQENAEQVKSIRKRLSPQSLMEKGIGPALRDMCAHYQESTDTKFTISFSDHIQDLPEETSIHLYRIAHEGVTNALRHGKAANIALLLTRSEGSYRLEVINDGNPMPETPTKGLGMRLVQQRAEAINAQAKLETTHDGKTRLECVVPLPATSHCGSGMSDRFHL